MTEPGITTRLFGTAPDGREAVEYTLDNGRGVSVSVIPFGGIVTRLECPDREGKRANVVLGFAELTDYLTRNPHFGTLVGRVGNRIAGGRFTIAGTTYQVPLNDGPNSLHGGTPGFGARWWTITPLPPAADGSVALDLTLTSDDGDQGYPGTLRVSVRYTLTPGNEWRIDYEARTDQPTMVNLTHHGYYNLAGHGSALKHRLTLAASHFAAVDATLIPQAIEAVDGTPFDFRQATAIEARLRHGHPQLARGRGYDHHWFIDRGNRREDQLAFAARLEDPASGRLMEVFTTQPGLQFYSGNFLDGQLLGAGGEFYRQGDGVCLETQAPPNTPNWPEGGASTLLTPDAVYRSTTLHRFGTSPAR